MHPPSRAGHRSGSMIPGQCSAGNRRGGPHRPWSDLPTDLVRDILLRLPCRADRVYFSAVCHPWRSAARGLPAPVPHLPWLLLPSPAAPSFFSLHSGATRPLHLSEKVRGATPCGSHPGGWVALAFDHWRDYAAVNLSSGATVPLPDRLRTNLPSLHLRGGTSACEHPMLIRFVAFSDAPSTDRCLAAAHVSSAFNLAFWRPGVDRRWVACGPPVDDVIQDIIHYRNELKEGFHVLSSTENVAVYSPNGGGPSAPLVMSRSSYRVRKRADYEHGAGNLSRYLVESRGNLLMVLRQLRQGRTFRFRIFRMNLGTDQVSWVELHTLPGRLLLLGRGCSRAFEVPHCNDDDGNKRRPFRLGYNICFLDDTGLALTGGSYADMGMNVEENRDCKDRPWHFPRPFTSQCSPPIWFAP